MQCMEVWGGSRAADNGVVMPGLDCWVYARPFEDDPEGGDIHYLSCCATGRIVRLLVADVAGHGEPVARLTGRLRGLMRRYLNYVDQRALVAEVNREFSGVADEGRFATAIVATCWTPTEQIALTNAGHPPPARFDSRRGRWSLLSEHLDRDARVAEDDEPRNLPLGIRPASYDEHRLRLARGDLLLIYSDALIEAKSPDGSFLGTDGLLGILRTLDHADPQRLIANLRAEVRGFSARDDDDDDLTIMILRTNGLKPRGGLGTGVKAGSRLAADFVRSLRPGRPFARPQLTLRNIAGAFIDRLNRCRR